MIEHVLKVVSPYFDALLDGSKTFECRYDDRGFGVGDRLVLREYFPLSSEFGAREVARRVTYILRDFDGLRPGWVVLGLAHDWQPISTAPRDGTHFLAYESGNIYRAFVHPDGYFVSRCGQPVAHQPEPTHWQPLLSPNPPASTGVG